MAPVAADVDEAAQLAVAAAGEEDREHAGPRRRQLPRFRDLVEARGVLPRAREEPLLLEAEDRRVRVPVKSYLLEHTAKLTGFTADFETVADRYYAEAAAGFDYAALARRAERRAAREGALDRGEPLLRARRGRRRRDAVARRLRRHPRRRLERDARIPRAPSRSTSSSPTAACCASPGNLFNLTEGMLWGTLPEFVAQGVEADLDGDGSVEFGEVLPDAAVCSRRPPTRSTLYAGEARPRRRAPGRRRASDAFTARRRDGADDERVLRAVEGRRASSLGGKRATATRSTSSRGSRTSTTSSAGCA